MEKQRRRGRKPSPKHPLAPAELAAARRTLTHLIKVNDWSIPAIADVFSAFGHAFSSQHSLIEMNLIADVFYPEHIEITRFLKGEANSQVNKAMYLWLSAEYSPEINLYLREELVSIKEKFVVSCKELLGHGSNINLSKTDSFNGDYQLYRPFHLSPLKGITAGILSIGGLESQFECTLHETFLDEGQRRHTYARGRIVPHGARLLAIMETTDKSRSHFFFHFGTVLREGQPLSDKTRLQFPQVVELGGIVIAAVGPDLPSSWPCYAIRVPDHEEARPRSFDIAEVSSLPPPVRRAMKRGGVYWRESEFPDPFRLG